MNTRTVVLDLMPAFVAILKERFPNLTAEESVSLAGKLADAVAKVEKVEERIHGKDHC
jgi:hypothetical protein